MDREMVTVKSQQVFEIKEKTTTFIDSGNKLSSVEILLGDLTINILNHSHSDSAKISIFGLDDSEVTIFGKVTKKQTTVTGTTWTDIISKVE
tara:strand:- start:2320 stop:2595 length:276 start_codon:yes stop_codon:yes gene_type:complete